ncbi:hypothetical protein GCM10023231_15020 [Olivibacter ginsenosidimutans]|uniref:Lipoprotein n=1 Tax=Olivibacter ginsenosidimutans TaxID=1176537 RepID=A0ABP9B0I2_9SPHI
MKYLSLTVLVLCLLNACKDPELQKEEAFRLLKENGRFPLTHTYNIYTKDSEDGRKLIDAGLEKEGVVTVERNRKTGDNHAPIIEFTEKAKPYLLAPDKGQLSSVQKVMTGEEVLDEITALKMNPEKTAAAINYTTKFIRITPFAVLDKAKFDSKKNYQAKFVLTKQGWELQQN